MKRRWREAIFGVTMAKHLPELAEMAGPFLEVGQVPRALKEASRGAVSRKPRPPWGWWEAALGLRRRLWSGDGGPPESVVFRETICVHELFCRRYILFG